MRKRFLILMAISMLLGISGALAEPKQVQFYFFDENNCSLDGYLFNGEKLIGKTENGLFNLTYQNYKDNVDLAEEISLFGKLGNCSSYNLYFDKSWISFEIPEYYFSGNSIFKFQASINPHNPSKKELLGFIQPEEVMQELVGARVDGKDMLEDISRMNVYLHKKIVYADDWNFSKEENYWQTSNETLSLGRGDCEDYSTVLLSMITAYNDTLNCYNIIFSSHVATLCYVKGYYIYYDQEKTELREKIPGNSSEISSLLKELKREYLAHYGLKEDETAHYAFNDYEFIEFKDEEEFIAWQSTLSKSKKKQDLFQELEKELSGLNITYSESEELIELANTAPQELPSLKGFIEEYSSLLILLGAILILLIIILIWMIIRK